MRPSRDGWACHLEMGASRDGPWAHLEMRSSQDGSRVHFEMMYFETIYLSLSVRLCAGTAVLIVLRSELNVLRITALHFSRLDTIWTRNEPSRTSQATHTRQRAVEHSRAPNADPRRTRISSVAPAHSPLHTSGSVAHAHVRQACWRRWRPHRRFAHPLALQAGAGLIIQTKAWSEFVPSERVCTVIAYFPPVRRSKRILGFELVQ